MDILSLLPQFGSLLWTILAFVAALSIIVAVHEYGHYIVGRWSGIHADVFSLGFGPVLFSGTDRRGTVWQVAALPFGGYVKFRGDANAASAPDGQVVAEMTAAQRRTTMAGAPLWARTATVAAGPVFNFILAIVIFTVVGMARGEVAEPLTVKDLRPLPIEHGLQEGDILLAIDGRPVPPLAEFATLRDSLEPAPLLAMTVERDGRRIEIDGPWLWPAIATSFQPQSPAIRGGMQVGDIITGVDGAPVFNFDQLLERVNTGEGAAMELEIFRNGDSLALTLAPRVVDDPLPEGGFRQVYRLGIMGGIAFVPETETKGLGRAFVDGVSTTYGVIERSITGLWAMITRTISSCNISGPLGIAEVSGQMASMGGWSFLFFLGVLSVAVGFLNLFPIPVLDGGHLVFFAYEAVTGKPPSDRAMQILMTTGLVIILTLMVFALSNDIFC